MKQRLFVGLSVAALMLTACGGGGSTAAPSSGGAGASAAPSSGGAGASAGASAGAAASGGADLKGKTVTVGGAFVDKEAIAFEAAVKPFEDATGVKVTYNGDKSF